MTIAEIAAANGWESEDVESVLEQFGGLDTLQKWGNIDDLAAFALQACEAIADGTRDFESDQYRFIHEDDIDEIQRDELAGDEYILGCFNAEFLANVMGAPVEAIEAMQKAEAFEALGKWIIQGGFLDDLQDQYRRADGYGHHFAHYDGHEHALGKWYAFRI